MKAFLKNLVISKKKDIYRRSASFWNRVDIHKGLIKNLRNHLFYLEIFLQRLQIIKEAVILTCNLTDLISISFWSEALALQLYWNHISAWVSVCLFLKKCFFFFSNELLHITPNCLIYIFVHMNPRFFSFAEISPSNHSREYSLWQPFLIVIFFLQ